MSGNKCAIAHYKSLAEKAKGKQPLGFISSLVLAATIASALSLPATIAKAQGYDDIKSNKSPLVLKSAGSFFIGGDKVPQTLIENGNIYIPDVDNIIINQMFVEYRVPYRNGEKKPAVIMLHGATLSGKTYDTTPDGRMGWYEYFVRKGHTVFIPDQVGRARSGFDQRPYNNVRYGVTAPDTQPVIRRRGEMNAWVQFRFGPEFGTAYPDEKFPVGFADDFLRQGIPEFNAGLPSPNPNFAALATLADDVGGAVVMGHSQSGTYPISAALSNPKGVAGLVLVEPGGCSASSYTTEQMEILKKIPMLIIYGDNLDGPTAVPGFSWRSSYDGCNSLAMRVNAAGGDAKMLYLPAVGEKGNSHMLMQDMNNLKIADRIMRWIDNKVKVKKK